MSTVILGTGTALPAHAITQTAAAAMAEILCCRAEAERERLQTIYQGSAVSTRRRVVLESETITDPLGPQSFYRNGSDRTGLNPTTAERMRRYEAEAVPLGAEAARAALDDAGVSAGQITHLVAVSCTGFFAPGLDAGLIQSLGLRSTTKRTMVGFMGCHGALNGLQVVEAITGADPHARVLLCAVELCSLHLHCGWDPGKVVANALFADGAAALVASGEEAAAEGWQLCATASNLVPSSAEDMTWRIRNHGFEMTLSRRVPSLIRTHLRPWLSAWLREQGLSVEEIAAWAVHPGGPRILDAVEGSLGLSPEALTTSRAVLAELGNMSSPTVLFIMQRLMRAGSARPCVALGFGPGLVAEGALFR